MSKTRTDTLKIAITGADGFLGKAVVKQLKSQKIAYTQFSFKKHNLLDPESLKSFVSGKNVIIHLAAVNRGENIELYKVNTLSTLSLLEAAAKYSPTAKIIFSSSFQVYLNSGLYGLSKKAAEQLIEEYTQKTNLKGVILRISNIYGPGGKPFYNSVIATFAHLIKNSEPIKINGNGLQKRDFIYVEDVAEAITKSIFYESQNPVEKIDICSGQETSLNQILSILRKVSGKKFAVMYNRDVKEKSWQIKAKNFELAYKLLGWKPKTSLIKGLGEVLNYESKN